MVKSRDFFKKLKTFFFYKKNVFYIVNFYGWISVKKFSLQKKIFYTKNISYQKNFWSEKKKFTSKKKKKINQKLISWRLNRWKFSRNILKTEFEKFQKENLVEILKCGYWQKTAC